MEKKEEIIKIRERLKETSDKLNVPRPTKIILRKKNGQSKINSKPARRKSS